MFTVPEIEGMPRIETLIAPSGVTPKTEVEPVSPPTSLIIWYWFAPICSVATDAVPDPVVIGIFEAILYLLFHIIPKRGLKKNRL